MHANFKQYLADIGACKEAKLWVGDISLPEAWAICQRGDWMLLLAQKAGIDIRPLTLAKAECAALAIPYMEHEASRNAVEVARKFGKGEATKEELDAADAYDAYAYAAAAKGGAFAQCADIVRGIMSVEMLNLPGL